MAHLDHNAAYEEFKSRVLDGIRSHFPDGKMVGKVQTLALDGLEVHDADMHADNIKSQLEAKVSNGDWAAPVFATFTLTDNATGKVIERKKMRIAEIPRTTRRHSYILGGQEYQVENQWQLKPGAYSRRRQTGELETQFNIANKPTMEITFNPATKRFLIERGTSKAIPLYPVMKVMGVDDDTLERTWGKEILDVNRHARGVASGIEKFYRADKKKPSTSKEEAEKYVYETLHASELRPEATAATLGKPLSHVTSDVLTRATAKLLKLQAGAPEDDRDSLAFKDLRSVGDFAYDKLTNYKTVKAVKDKIHRKLNAATGVRDIIKFDMFNDHVKNTFHKNSLAQIPDQINPVEMLSAAQQTTVMGPGGIRSAQQVVLETKFVNPSHLGFLDPVKTPESEKTGVTLRLPMGVTKVGKEPQIAAYNLKTQRMELLGPSKFIKATVVLPDQVTWKAGKPVPKTSKVRVSSENNKIEETQFSQADYVLRHPSQLFSVATNLIPFMANTSGNRATYASNHLEQAISLAHREPPLVQVGTGAAKEGIATFEQLVGRQSGHPSPITGTVVKVVDDAVHIKAKDGSVREVQLYNNFPLNDAKSFLHSTPLVKVGDKVSAGQSVADTNFTKNGQLALGTNLQVGYIPYKGYNFEDGVVLSESAASKLSSIHLHKPSIPIDEKITTSPKKFQIQHPTVFSKDQYAKLDDHGIVRVGQKVLPGDPLVVAMRPYQLKDRMGLGALRRSMSGQHTDVSLRWDSDYAGEVVGVHKRDKDILVHVRTMEPMQVGDKLTGRYGNKGVVTLVLPDKNMPHTKDGKHLEVLLNPSGIPGRMNTGQVFETAAAKIAKKTGKPYIVDNFGTEDMIAKVKEDLKAHGISDTEEVLDPVTGVSLGHALVGPQHILKLKHQVDKKIAARAGMGIVGGGYEHERYDMNLMPTGGAKTGGQSIGHLGINALLAHGAKANIREMQTWKSEGIDPATSEAKRWSSQHELIWRHIQTGEPLPPPKSTFAFQKFTDMLRAAGINVEKKGHTFQVMPLTDRQILNLSNGAIPKPTQLTYPKPNEEGEPKPITGGLFDPKITGGHGGRNWSHIPLAEPVPNPVYAGAIQKILGLTEKQYTSIVHGEMGVKNGKVVALDTTGASTGGHAIHDLLAGINVSKELAATEKELSTQIVPATPGVTAPKIDKLVKKVKYLRALDRLGMKPEEAYVLKNLPILPPVMRSASVLPDGAIKWADINGLYQKFAQVNTELKDPTVMKHLPTSQKSKLRRDLYDGVAAIVGTASGITENSPKGILEQIHGTTPKGGFFQRTLMNRKQDLTMRSVIAPEPSLGIDEVGLPKSKATTLFRPFLVKKLVDMGAASNPLEAQELIKNDHQVVHRALELVTDERPVLLKRDPALHKHSVQAFKARLVPGRAIQIHPLVTGGFNADFDGDTMSVYVPISEDAVAEARKMFPSSNLFSDATGAIMYTPTHESALGIYKLSKVNSGTPKSFGSHVESLKAVQNGALTINDPIKVNGIVTTPGRVLLADALPHPMKHDMLTGTSAIDSKGLKTLYSTLAKNHSGEFDPVANRLKDLGNGASFGAVDIPHPDHKGPSAIYAKEAPSKRIQFIPTTTHSLSLKDFEPDRGLRDRILNEAQKEVNKIQKTEHFSAAEKERRTIMSWMDASKKMDDEHLAKVEKHPTNLSLMLKAGVKPSKDQYKQMVLAPVLVTDAAGRVVPAPIKKSYSEGLDVAGYWTQMSGARGGSVMKVQEVQDPGFLSKQLIASSMNLVVAAPDCGTTHGISIHAGSPDVHDRELVREFSAKGVTVPPGTILTPDLVSKIRTIDKNATLVVRSPLKCEHDKGVCQKCAGLSASGGHYDLGTNIGVISAQALGERSMQLTLKAFHSGGVYSGGKKLINQFGRVEQLFRVPKTIPDATVLAMKSGVIEKMEKDPTGVKVHINGHVHHIGKDRMGLPLHEHLAHESKAEGYRPWKVPIVGERVEAGQPLSDPNRTYINPHDLYRATGSIERVQQHLTEELHDIYKNEGVRRPHIETVVKAMGNLTKVRDPGDADGILRGEFQPHSKIRALNTELVKAGKRPVQHMPVLQGIDILPLSVQEDWMAKLMHNRLRQTLQEAAAEGAVSHIHGLHPVPGMAYGAEFGLNKAHSNKPGLGHLKDVSAYAY